VTRSTLPDRVTDTTGLATNWSPRDSGSNDNRIIDTKLANLATLNPHDHLFLNYCDLRRLWLDVDGK